MNTWKVCSRQTIETKEYVVDFYRLYVQDWGFMGMADRYTYEATGKFFVRVTKWEVIGRNEKVANHCCEHIDTKEIDKDIANLLYWNFKNRNISYKTAKEYFKKEGLLED